MVHFYPKSHVTISPLVLLMSAKPGSRLFVIAYLFVQSNENARMADRQKAGQTVICRAVNHHWFRQGRQTQWPERGPASKTTCERAGMYSPLHCGFVSEGKSADSLTHRTLWGWGMWRGRVGGGQHNFRESECKVRRSVWITAIMLFTTVSSIPPYSPITIYSMFKYFHSHLSWNEMLHVDTREEKNVVWVSTAVTN